MLIIHIDRDARQNPVNQVKWKKKFIVSWYLGSHSANEQEWILSKPSPHPDGSIHYHATLKAKCTLGLSYAITALTFSITSNAYTQIDLFKYLHFISPYMAVLCVVRVPAPLFSDTVCMSGVSGVDGKAPICVGHATLCALPNIVR